MPSYVTGAQERNSWRFHIPAPGDMSQRDDLAAVVAVVAFMAQLIFAQFTLALVICFIVVGKLSRWRPLWLMVPAGAGFVWVLGIGVKPAFAGYLAWAGQLVKLIAGQGAVGGKVEVLRDLLTGWRLWLPRQAPVALVIAAAQVGAIGRLPGRRVGERHYRRGALVVMRCGYLAATLRRGELATRDGCCLGIVPSTGRRAAISWQEAESGVLGVGQDADAVAAIGRDLALAAIQHRKTVIIVDLAGDATSAGDVESQCAAVAAPLQRFGGRNADYDPLSTARPARATSLVMAMIDWAGVTHARQLFCANYLNAAFTVLEASRAGAMTRADRGAVLEELVRLMSPGALRGRLIRLPGSQQADRLLAARVAELSGQLDVDPAVLVPVVTQLAELSSATAGQLRRPPADGSSISLVAALAARDVVHFPIGRPMLSQPALMIARLVVADLIENLAVRIDHGSRADCLVWINGCEGIDRRQLAVLVALGERTGTAVVLGTAVGPVAASLAADVNVVAVRGASPPALTAQPASESPGPLPLPPDGLAEALARSHAPGRPDVLSFGVRQPQARLVAAGKAVR
jgi:hypothetical protein